VNLLCRDLEHTVGAGHERVVEEAAARIRLFSDDAADFEQRVVDEVQQELLCPGRRARRAARPNAPSV
jgi:hypothetical protein